MPVFKRKQRTAGKGKVTLYRQPKKMITVKALAKQGTPFQFRSIGSCVSNGSGVLAQNWKVSDASSVSDFTSIALLYDTWICTAMKLKLIPYHLGSESATFYRGNVATITDVDGTVPTTMAAAMEYGSFKLHDASKVITRYIKIPKHNRPIINSTSIAPLYNVNNSVSTIAIISDFWPNSQTVFWYEITYYITTNGRL